MRHADIEHNDVRFQLRRFVDRLRAVGRLPDDLDVSARFQDSDETLANDRMVVGDEDPDPGHHSPSFAGSGSGISASTMVPSPGADRSEKRPSTNSTRSRMARTPKPRSSSRAERRASGGSPPRGPRCE